MRIQINVGQGSYKVTFAPTGKTRPTVVGCGRVGRGVEREMLATEWVPVEDQKPLPTGGQKNPCWVEAKKSGQTWLVWH